MIGSYFRFMLLDDDGRMTDPLITPAWHAMHNELMNLFSGCYDSEEKAEIALYKCKSRIEIPHVSLVKFYC
jgi:hypothetical protein